MRNSKTITVRVSPKLYRQTRLLASQYDTTVTEIVADLLERLPRMVERLHLPVGGPIHAPAPASAVNPARDPRPAGPTCQPQPRFRPPPPVPQKPESLAVPLSSTSTPSTSITFTRTAARRTAAVPLSTPRKSHNSNRLRSNRKIPAAVVHWIFRCFSKFAVIRKISA
jgi:hypothetical protein